MVKDKFKWQLGGRTMKRKNNQIYLGVGQFNLECDEENREDEKEKQPYLSQGWLAQRQG